MVSNAYPVSTSLCALRGGIGISEPVVYRLPEGEAEEGANVRGGSSEVFQRRAPVEWLACHSVQYVGDVLYTQEPSELGGSCTVKDCISKSLNCLVTPLSWVLVLLVRLALPRGNPVGPEDVLHPVADLDLSPVAHQFVHGTMEADSVLKCIDKLPVGFHNIDLCYIGLCAKK